VIALLAATAVWALCRYRSRRDVTIPLVVALGLVPVQAVLGAIVVWLELPDRLVGVHFMVGMVMLALCMHACVAAWRGRSPVTRAFRRMALTAGAASLVLVSLGASVVSTDGMHACGEQWPGCNGGVAGGDATAVLQVMHRSTAYVVVALSAALLVLGLRGHAPLLAAVAPAAFGVAQVGVGIGMVLAAHGSLLHDVLRILHVAGAAALWASMVAVVSVSITPPTLEWARARRAHAPVPTAAVEVGRPT
jgi:cytochrome c oxidase assembly protein subunit 15